MGCNTSKQGIQSVINDASKSINDVQNKVEQATDFLEEFDPDDPSTQQTATKIQAVFRGHQTRKQMMKNTEEEKTNFELEFSPDDKELTDAATKIQASFRGHMARKQVNEETSKVGEEEQAEDALSSQLEKLDANKSELEQELLDIDLTDPELHKAATKIQASFRGHKVRKETDEDGTETKPSE